MVPRLSDLREPPLPGRFYLVPVIRWKWLGVLAEWPVFGPAHQDADFFAFPHRHYHFDPRFVAKGLAARVEMGFYNWSGGYTLPQLTQGYPLAPLHGSGDQLPKGRPPLARRRCQSAEWAYGFSERQTVVALRRHYGDDGIAAADAITLRDGRKLCPHRKADLSSLPCGEDGIVQCPLHGLRVRVRSAAA